MAQALVDAPSLVLVQTPSGEITHVACPGLNAFIFGGNREAYWTPFGETNSVQSIGTHSIDTSEKAKDIRRQLRFLMVSDALNDAYRRGIKPVTYTWARFLKRWGLHRTNKNKPFSEPKQDFLKELERIVISDYNQDK